MADLIEGLTMTLKCIDTNEGVRTRGLPVDRCGGYLKVDETIVGVMGLMGGRILYRKDSPDIMLSFVGVKSNDIIGTLKRGYLEVQPGIGVNVNNITSKIPDSYRKIPMTGLYIDTNKVDVQCSKIVKFDGVVRTHVTRLFHGRRVETIRDGVCTLCHQRTNHSPLECPSGDVGLERNENHGPNTRMIPVRTEYAVEKELRFNSAPERADENELRAKFEEFGKVETVYLLRDRGTGMFKLFRDRGTGLSKGVGLVTFVNRDDAKRAFDALKDEYQMFV